MNGQRTQNLKANDGSVLKLSQCIYKKYRSAKHEATKNGLTLEVFPDGKVALKDRKTLEYVFGDDEHRKAVKAILRHFKRLREKKAQEKGVLNNTSSSTSGYVMVVGPVRTEKETV